MSSIDYNPRRRRLYVLAACSLLAIGIGAAIGVSTSRRTAMASISPPPAAVPAPARPAPAAPPAVPSTATADPSAPAAKPATTSVAAALAPSFDVVRVTPDGSAVLAGRAAPGASVTVQQGDVTVGRAQADSRGSWVMVPTGKLPAGAAELLLTARGPSGETVKADAPVVIVVPAPTQGAAPTALALLMPSTGPSRLLQAPPAPAPSSQKLGLDTVDYDEHGAIRFAGSAPPDTPVRAYVDNGRVGDTTADGGGHWTMSPPQGVEPGMHQLRLDQLTPQGQVASRVEMPFKRETLAQAQVADGQVVVQPGQNLWRLARRSYGAGIRYTVIFLANRDQIRDARLIYPGQVFATPGAPTPEPAAAVSSH